MKSSRVKGLNFLRRDQFISTLNYKKKMSAYFKLLDFFF